MTPSIDTHVPETDILDRYAAWVGGGHPLDLVEIEEGMLDPMTRDEGRDRADPRHQALEWIDAMDSAMAREMSREMRCMMRRDHFIARFGFAVVAAPFVPLMRELGPCLEVGAGPGTLTRLLRNDGQDAIASDIHGRDTRKIEATHFGGEAWTEIFGASAEAAIRNHPDRTVLMSWPCYDKPWSRHALDAMAPGQTLVFIGEIGGCTGDDWLPETIRSAFCNRPTTVNPRDALWSFPMIHDRISVLRKI